MNRTDLHDPSTASVIIPKINCEELYIFKRSSLTTATRHAYITRKIFKKIHLLLGIVVLMVLVWNLIVPILRYHHQLMASRAPVDEWRPALDLTRDAIVLEYHTTMEARPMSIFYSFYVNGSTLVGFGREHHDGSRVIQVWADLFFRIFRETTSKDDKIVAEDPRIFRHNETWFVMNNNLFSEMKLYNTATKTFTPIKKGGKNFSMISHKGRLYFIYMMRPFEMYEVDMASGAVVPVAVNRTGIAGQPDDTWRGGTPGYRYGPQRPGTYYGFGHRTYSQDGVLLHDPYFWVVDFASYELPTLEIKAIRKPEVSKNICDPTSVVVIQGKPYLVTAESEKNWYQEDQKYYNNVYEIHVNHLKTRVMMQ